MKELLKSIFSLTLTIGLFFLYAFFLITFDKKISEKEYKYLEAYN